MSRNILTGEEEQRIMPNTRSPVMRQVIRPNSYVYMLREAKAKKALRTLNAQNRRELISNTISGAKRVRGLAHDAGIVIKDVSRSGRERLERTRTSSGMLDKIRAFKNKSIYEK